MKIIKLLFILLVFAGIASCSNDDDSGGNNSNSTEANRIVGKWSLQTTTINGEVIEMADCEELVMEFLSNGRVNYTETYQEWESENCETDTYHETWEYVGNNIYKFTDEDNFSYNVPIIFSNNNRTFTVTEEDEDGRYTVVFTKM